MFASPNHTAHSPVLSRTPTPTTSSSDSTFDFHYQGSRYSTCSSATSATTDGGDEPSIWYGPRDLYTTQSLITPTRATYAAEDEYEWASDSGIAPFPLSTTTASFRESSLLFYANDYCNSFEESLRGLPSISSMTLQSQSSFSPPHPTLPFPGSISCPTQRRDQSFEADTQVIVTKCLVQLSTKHLAPALLLVDLFSDIEKPIKLDLDDILEIFVDVSDDRTTTQPRLDAVYFHGIINQVVRLATHTGKYDAWLALELDDAKGAGTLLIVHESDVETKFKPHFLGFIGRCDAGTHSPSLQSVYEYELDGDLSAPNPGAASTTGHTGHTVTTVVAEPTVEVKEPRSRFSAYTDDGDLVDSEKIPRPSSLSCAVCGRLAKGGRHGNGPILRTDGTWSCSHTKRGCRRLPLSTRISRLVSSVFGRINRRS